MYRENFCRDEVDGCRCFNATDEQHQKYSGVHPRVSALIQPSFQEQHQKRHNFLTPYDSEDSLLRQLYTECQVEAVM